METLTNIVTHIYHPEDTDCLVMMPVMIMIGDPTAAGGDSALPGIMHPMATTVPTRPRTRQRLARMARRERSAPHKSVPREPG